LTAPIQSTIELAIQRGNGRQKIPAKLVLHARFVGNNRSVEVSDSQSIKQEDSGLGSQIFPFSSFFLNAPEAETCDPLSEGSRNRLATSPFRVGIHAACHAPPFAKRCTGMTPQALSGASGYRSLSVAAL